MATILLCDVDVYACLFETAPLPGAPHSVSLKNTRDRCKCDGPINRKSHPKCDTAGPIKSTYSMSKRSAREVFSQTVTLNKIYPSFKPFTYLKTNVLWFQFAFKTLTDAFYDETMPLMCIFSILMCLVHFG